MIGQEWRHTIRDSALVDREALRKQLTELGVDAKSSGLSELEELSEADVRRMAERVGKVMQRVRGMAGPAGVLTSDGRVLLAALVLPDDGPEWQDAAADPDTARWREELAFFDGIRDELAKDERYCGKYVAVKDKQVIDADADDVRLTERIDERFPDEVVLIAGVGTDDPVVELPSPEVAR